MAESLVVGHPGPLPSVAIALRFYGDPFDPAEITRRLKLEPTQQFEPGDPILKDGEGRRSHFGWRFRIGPRGMLYIDDLLQEFREQVSLGSGVIELCNDLEIQAVVACEVSQEDAEVFPAIDFPADFLSWVAEMGASLVVDVLF